jgi:hypothetical protein
MFRSFDRLAGHSVTLYSLNDELVMLKQPQYEDRLTKTVHRWLPVLFIVSWVFASETRSTNVCQSGGRRDENTAHVSEKRIAGFFNVLSILLTIVLLFVAIISLYVTSKPSKKLGIIGTFIVLFVANVGLVTTAR